MATFPAITPSSRTFTPGNYPATPFVGHSGKRQTIRHSNVFRQAQLRLAFVALTEAEMLQILSHYVGHGTLGPFDLSAEVISNGNLTDYVLSNYLWRYIDDGEIEDYSCGGHGVIVNLETVAPSTITLPGCQLALQLVLVPGAVLSP